MNEESDVEKTEPPSPRRLEKAREEGQVARSRELVTFGLLSAGLAGLWLTAAGIGRSLEATARQGLGFGRAVAFDPSHMLQQAGAMALHTLLALAPWFALVAVAALVTPVLLGGWLFSAKAAAPKWSKLDPVAGIGRMFSSQSLADLLKALAKIVLVGSIAAVVIGSEIDDMMALMAQSAPAGLAHMLRLVAVSCAWMIAGLLLIALADVPYQLWAHHRKLRMSHEEVRREHKENEGDPHVKARIRRLQQQVARRRMMADVASADVVVTNPTHFSVALRYAEGRMRAPRVVAKGTDQLALRIRATARAAGVSILEAPALTRALYRHTRLGDEIPGGLYTAVAELLAWVYRLRQCAAEGLEAPPAPEHLPVPADLQVDSP